MKCKRCGRELKSENSIELEYGKKCYELTFGDNKKEEIKKIKGYFL
jgi:hypothetical protein